MIASLGFGFTFVDIRDFIPPFGGSVLVLKTAPSSFLPFDLHGVEDLGF
jgi:hypothetical protein